MTANQIQADLELVAAHVPTGCGVMAQHAYAAAVRVKGKPVAEPLFGHVALLAAVRNARRLGVEVGR